MKEGGLPLPPTFQNLIFMTRRGCDLNFVMISSLASKCQDFKLRGLEFHFIKQDPDLNLCTEMLSAFRMHIYWFALNFNKNVLDIISKLINLLFV